jgi:hypothetical protein
MARCSLHPSLCCSAACSTCTYTHLRTSTHAFTRPATPRSQGGVTSLKLSPNLRRITPIPTPEVKKGDAAATAPSREEVEIRKMDRLLALSDAKITIVTPIPGQVKAKRPGVAAVGGGEEGAGAEASAGAVAEP